MSELSKALEMTLEAVKHAGMEASKCDTDLEERLIEVYLNVRFIQDDLNLHVTKC